MQATVKRFLFCHRKLVHVLFVSPRTRWLQGISAAFCILSLLTFKNAVRAYNDDNKTIPKHSLWALIAASFFGAVMIIGFFVFGTLILLRKTVSETGLSYSYGALHWSSFWMAVLTLLCAVSIHGYKDDMNIWEKDPPAGVSIEIDLPRKNPVFSDLAAYGWTRRYRC
jgi:hypothetical protein